MRLAELRQGVVASAESARDTADGLPRQVKSFVEAFQGLETPRVKAILQTILKAVYVWNDNRIEVDFK